MTLEEGRDDLRETCVVVLWLQKMKMRRKKEWEKEGRKWEERKKKVN